MTPVETTSGPVVGSVHGGIARYLGIPYAAPPTGERRFAAPAPVEPATAPIDATAFGPSAPQLAEQAPNGLLPGFHVGAQSENCLSLNILQPVGASDRPVLVWFHPGAYDIGGTSEKGQDGTHIVETTGAVFVSVNYRLGALGWLALEGDGAIANAGLADQAAGLRWVRDNIAAFGGDPGRVTIFGESAGGGSVLSLMSSPLAEGLFARAIVHSGASDSFLSRESAERIAADLAVNAGCAPGDVAALRALPVDAILAAQIKTAIDNFGQVGVMPFHPTTDPASLPLDWFDAAAAGASQGVDLMIGTTHDEMRLYLPIDPAAAQLDEDGLARRIGRIGADPWVMIDLYRQVDGDLSPPDLWWKVASDTKLWLPSVRFAEAHAAGGGRTWMFRFDHPAADPSLGACHAVDLPFIFGTLDVAGWHEFVSDLPVARVVSEELRGMWGRYAADGDPGWPCYDLATRTTRVIGGDGGTVDAPRDAVRAAWAAALGW